MTAGSATTGSTLGVGDAEGLGLGTADGVGVLVGLMVAAVVGVGAAVAVGAGVGGRAVGVGLAGLEPSAHPDSATGTARAAVTPQAAILFRSDDVICTTGIVGCPTTDPRGVGRRSDGSFAVSGFEFRVGARATEHGTPPSWPLLGSEAPASPVYALYGRAQVTARGHG